MNSGRDALEMKEKTTGTGKRFSKSEREHQLDGQLYIENTETSSELINDFFYESILSCEKALYAALQFQEDTLKIWANFLEKTGSPLPVRKEMEVLSTRIFPDARTRLDQVLEVSSLRIMLLNRASSQIVGLMARAATLWNATSLPETWQQIDNLGQRFLKILSADSGIFFNTNTKILQICMELTNPHPFMAALSEENPLPEGRGLRKIFRIPPETGKPSKQHRRDAVRVHTP